MQTSFNETPQKSPDTKWGMVILVAIIFSVAFGSLFGFLAGSGANIIAEKLKAKIGFSTPSTTQTEIIKKSLIEEDSAVTQVVEDATPGVVSIIITKDVPRFRSFFENPFFFQPFNDNTQGGTETQKVGGGSGFFVTSDGLIITNKHVVSDTSAQYTVVTSDGKEYSARVLARHPSLDIAILKVDGSNFPVIDLGDSESLKVGQTVIAIGYSLGEFSNSVSKGIISGLQRNVTAGSGFSETERLTNIIQTDAAINPGNSGGPLLDVSGKVIGVNVAMAQGAENVGFSLPIDPIKSVIDSVKKEGKISIPYIGVRYIIINDAIKTENNLPFDYGALVLRGERTTDLAVVPGSPADRAGIVENDIILEINGQKITEDNQLADIITKYQVGETVALKIWHKGETKDVQATLEERK